MIVPLETCELDVASSQECLPEMLERLLKAELPAFVIHDAWDDVNQVADAATGCFNTSGFSLSDRIRVFNHDIPSARRAKIMKKGGLIGQIASVKGFGDQKVSFRGVTSLHADALPSEEAVSLVLMHTTKFGAAKATFLEPTITMVERYKRRSKIPTFDELFATFGEMPLPNSAYALMKAGLVDDEVLNPIKHVATLNAGSTVFFRAGGRQPLYHRFVSTVMPRQSVVRGAERKVGK